MQQQDEKVNDIDALFAHAPVETNAKGAKQSRLDYRYDGISPTAMRRLAHVRWYGMQRYPEHNWKGIPAREHMNRALHHIFSWLDGDTSEDHAGHAFCRLMFAVDLEQNAPVTQEQIGEENGKMLFDEDELREGMKSVFGVYPDYARAVLERIHKHQENEDANG